MLRQKIVRISVIVLVATAITVGAAAMVMAKTTYKVASDIAWPPFEMVDEQGNYVGIDLDLMREIAKMQGYEVEFVDVVNPA